MSALPGSTKPASPSWAARSSSVTGWTEAVVTKKMAPAKRSSSDGQSARTISLRSDDTDARYSQGAQGIDMEHSETGSCQ